MLNQLGLSLLRKEKQIHFMKENKQLRRLSAAFSSMPLDLYEIWFLGFRQVLPLPELQMIATRSSI